MITQINVSAPLNVLRNWISKIIDDVERSRNVNQNNLLVSHYLNRDMFLGWVYGRWA